MNHSRSGKTTRRSHAQPWLLRGLAAVFQVVSAQATYTGALKFVVDVKPFAAIITFGIQLGLLVAVHLLSEILTGEQTERTSAIPPLLALSIILPLSVFFSTFGFYEHYGLRQGNHAAEIRLTTEEVSRAAAELDRYRLDALTYVSGEVEQREAEKKRQQARASNTYLKEPRRAAAGLRAAQLEREAAELKQAENQLQNVDVIGSVTREQPDAMRRDLLSAQRTIANAIAQHAPDYMKDHAVPQRIPVAPPAAEVQEGFFRDLRLKTTAALTTMTLASVVDFLSSLFILCAIKVSPTEERILNFKRKLRRIYRATLPLAGMADTYTPIQFKAHGAGVTSEFLVHFVKADDDLTGFDAIANLPAIQDQLNRTRQLQIEIQAALNAAGEELSPSRPLFDQLGPDRTVYLQLVQQDTSNWAEELADEAA